MIKFVVAAVWAALIIMKLVAVPAIVGISWWFIIPFPLFVAGILFVLFTILMSLAAFGLSGYADRKVKKLLKED